MTLQEILKLRTKIFTDKNTKIIKHKDTRGIEDFKEIVNNRDLLLEYQREQKKDRFKCEYIISFIGLDFPRSLLFGIFKVNRDKMRKRNKCYYYDLKEVSVFKDLNERLVIDWGKSAQAWNQWYYNKKEIIEILPEGFIGQFPGYERVILSFNDLEKIIKNRNSNKDWVNHLSSVSGVYLILDTNENKQYVGSACGINGILGRWENYITNKSGGNKKLLALLENDKKYYRNFQFSILQTLPNNITKSEIIKIERAFMEKLGTRSDFHLNT